MYKQSNSSSNKITTNNLRETHKQQTIQLIQPESETYLFAAEWWAGCIVFSLLFVVLEGFCVFRLLFFCLL